MWGDAPGYFFVINVQMQHKSGHCMEAKPGVFPFCSGSGITPATPPACRFLASSVTAGGDPTQEPHSGISPVHRRGELSKHTIDRNWPHQVALPAYRCTDGNYVTIRLFCEGLSLSPRGHSFCRDGTDMNIFGFAEREHAEQFRDRFGGEFIDPKDRPKWPGSRR